MLILFLLLPPFIAALASALVNPYRLLIGRVNSLLALISLGASLAFAHSSPQGAAVFGPGEMFRIDGLSALMAVLVGFVAVLALVLGPGFSSSSHYAPAQMRRYQIYINLYIGAMLLAVSANNVGLMWIGIEATTIFSALIIPLSISKESVEASWKYILICSVGIALAFAGTVLGYFDFVSLSGQQPHALNWTVLVEAAHRLHPEVLKIAFVFLLVGYGTKAGIAPMHTWLPDAHSEAPAALSATMSGVLLSLALYAIVRWKVVVDVAVGSGFTDRLLLVLGIASVAVASFSVVISRNYKRMLAYSSIEHTGLMSFGLALGPAGVFAALLHMVNHTVVKSTLFVLSGRVSERYQTTKIAEVSGLAHVMPWTGGLFAAGLLASLGLPPFGMFLSEFALFTAGFAQGRIVLSLVMLALVAVAFVSFVSHLNKMLYGTAPAGIKIGEHSVWEFVPIGLSFVILLVLGFTIPSSLNQLIQEAVRIVCRN